ncbi:MAG: glycosyltransferase family 4 protein, partial [Planctomycetota bacterium]
VVHALSPGAWRAAAMLARKLGRPAVVTVHDFVDRPSDLPWPTGRWPFAIAPSEALRENLVNAGRMPKTRVTVVPMGLDLSLFVLPPETDDRELQTGVPRGPHEGATKVVGCIAPLHRGKGVGLFIGAAKRALDSHPDVEFVVSGSGPAEAELRAVAAKLGVRGRLTFVGGEVRAEELLRNLDVFVLPSPREAVGIPVLQAMASSKPVVAAGAGALFELVRDGETGFLVPPGDAKALAGKVTELLADKQRRVEMGQAGRELVEKEFPLERMVAGTTGVYSAALAAAQLRP